MWEFIPLIVAECDHRYTNMSVALTNRIKNMQIRSCCTSCTAVDSKPLFHSFLLAFEIKCIAIWMLNADFVFFFSFFTHSRTHSVEIWLRAKRGAEIAWLSFYFLMFLFPSNSHKFIQIPFRFDSSMNSEEWSYSNKW